MSALKFATIQLADDSVTEDILGPNSVRTAALHSEVSSKLTSGKLMAAVLLIGTLNLITANPINIADATLTGYSAGGSTSGSGTAGVLAGSFASSGAEVGIGSGEGGLGTDTPYPVADFGTVRDRVVQLRTPDGDAIGAQELLSSVTDPDASAPVFGFLSYRSDASANQKWRIWLYYIDSTGDYVPLTPDTAINSVSLYIVNVATLANMPVNGMLGVVQVGQNLASLVLGAGSVDTTQLADQAVEEAKLADGAVATAKLAGDSVTLAKCGFRPNAEESSLSSASTWDLAQTIDSDFVKSVQVDVNGQRLHYGADADASHFQVSGNGGASSHARITFGAAVTGLAQASYLY